MAFSFLIYSSAQKSSKKLQFNAQENNKTILNSQVFSFPQNLTKIALDFGGKKIRGAGGGLRDENYFLYNIYSIHLCILTNFNNLLPS